MKNGTTPQGAPGPQAEDNAASTTRTPQTEKLKKPRYQKKGGNGGARAGAGRKTTEETLEKRGLAQELDDHVWEEVEIVITNRRTGETLSEKRTRLRALLDTLAEKGLKDKDVQAIKEYFDRTLGKAPQSIAMKHTGRIGTYKAKRPSKAAEAGIEAYERALLAGKGK